MVNTNSPAVVVVEKDISEYAPTVESSIVGIVGVADRGPANKATLITSPESLIRTFGPPSENLTGQGLEGSLEVLEETNRLYFVRAVADSSVNASAVCQIGACPAVIVSANNFGVTSDLYLTVQVYDQDGTAQYTTAKQFNIPAATIDSSLTASSQHLALRKVIGGDADAATVGIFGSSTTDEYGMLVGAWAGSGASVAVSAWSDSSRSVAASALLPMDNNGEVSATMPGEGYSSIRSWGTSYDTSTASGVCYVAQSLYTGGGYNLGSKSSGDTSGVSVEIDNLGGQNTNLVVNDGGAASEYFKVSLFSGNFVEDVININDTTDVVSDLIKGEFYFSGSPATPTKLPSFASKITALGAAGGIGGTSKYPALNSGGTEYFTETGGGDWAGATPGEFTMRFNKFIDSTNGMQEGSTGTVTNANLIGSSTAATKTGIQALDDALLNVSIAMVPGITAQAVQNALITLAETTQEFLALVAPPYGVGSAQDAIDWSNGLSQTRTAALTSDYGAVYWPWVKVFSVFDGKDRWYDPIIFAARQMALTDNVSDPWFAPAGFRRGRLTKPTDVEVRLNKGDRDAMYSGGNVVNPIVNFAQQGITIFGQRTTKRTPSALDRVNVRRMMIQLRKIILLSTRQFIFEPNDEFTWNQIEEMVNPLLDDIKRRRGIVEFKVVCDETTNTPLRVDRNELWCKVLLKPTKTAEVIVFEINLTTQAAQLGS
tara:strand:- start:1151 stop:3292 length:2142 start_codon:yes stop_codon:yes gene_type:complete